MGSSWGEGLGGGGGGGGPPGRLLLGGLYAAGADKKLVRLLRRIELLDDAVAQFCHLALPCVLRDGEQDVEVTDGLLQPARLHGEPFESLLLAGLQQTDLLGERLVVKGFALLPPLRGGVEVN